MDKQAFLAQLEKGLEGLPQNEVTGCLTFYAEMIDDRLEEGVSEEEAVAEIGCIDELVAQIKADVAVPKNFLDSMIPKRKLKVWEIVLLAVGSPLWLALGVALFAVACALYVSVWAVIFSLWAVFAAVAVGALFLSATGIRLAFGGWVLPGIALIGAGLFCVGLTIFLLVGTVFLTKWTCVYTKKTVVWRKEGAQ